MTTALVAPRRVPGPAAFEDRHIRVLARYADSITPPFEGWFAARDEAAAWQYAGAIRATDPCIAIAIDYRDRTGRWTRHDSVPGVPLSVSQFGPAT